MFVVLLLKFAPPDLYRRQSMRPQQPGDRFLLMNTRNKLVEDRPWAEPNRCFQRCAAL